jgi:hypothetical protein
VLTLRDEKNADSRNKFLRAVAINICHVIMDTGKKCG